MATISQELALKLKAEDTFKPIVRRLFNNMIRDFRVTVALTGTPPLMSRYRGQLEAILRNHYVRVSKAFLGIVKRPTKQNENEQSEAELLALALLTWRDQQVTTSTNRIASTTSGNMTDSLQSALVAAAVAGVIPTNRELGLNASALLKRKLDGRVSGIAITETQAAAESAKYIEAEVLSSLKPRVLGGSGTQQTGSVKRWRTVGDSRVRPIHAAANGQRRRLNEPFVVNNQYLMFPGDGSLGATIDNLINCRCISQFIIA